jgi:arylsulfatase A-like enzyme/lipoprotein NlpI
LQVARNAVWTINFHRDIMSERLRKWVLLAIGLALIGRILWLIPRRSWSLKGPSQTTLSGNFSPKEIRHVVLISIDTCRADHLGCYGYSRKTSPNVDSVAADGIVFNHAVSCVPVTLPSHSSMLTGTIPLYHKVRDNNSYRLSGSNITLAEILRENGFATGAVIGAFVLDSQFGLDQGFDTYNDTFLQSHKAGHFSYNERSAEEVTHFANLWLEQHRSEKSFLFIHYYDLHDPYQLHKGFRFSSLPFVSFPKDSYDSEIAYTDRCIGLVIKKLKDLGIYDSTLLLITGDHGESLGAHGEKTHSYFIYHSTLHVPLIIRVPGGPKGRIHNLAGLIDIVPTVCGVLGIDAPACVQGKDLSGFFSGKGVPVDDRYIYCESLYPTKFGLGAFLGVVSDNYKYIHTSAPELYNLRKDPAETRNLLKQQGQQAQIMAEQLKLFLKDNRLADMADSRMQTDKETMQRLQSLGYVASHSVDENVQFEQQGPNPREYLEFYQFYSQYLSLMSSEEFYKAKKLCYKMLAKWPEIGQIYFYLGIVAVSEKDTQGTLSHFTRYLEFEDSQPDDNDFTLRANPDSQLAIAHTNVGGVYVQQGQPELAIEHFKKAVRYDPYNAAAINNLAKIYTVVGDPNDAVALYNRVLTLEPDDPAEVYCNLGTALLKLGRLDEAISSYKEALRLKPDWQQARDYLSIAEAKKK